MIMSAPSSVSRRCWVVSRAVLMETGTYYGSAGEAFGVWGELVAFPITKRGSTSGSFSGGKVKREDEGRIGIPKGTV